MSANLERWELKTDNRPAVILVNRNHTSVHRQGACRVNPANAFVIPESLVEVMWAGETLLRMHGSEPSRVMFCENCMCRKKVFEPV